MRQQFFVAVQQVVYDFIEHVGLDWMDSVEAVACDMNSDFQEAFEESTWIHSAGKETKTMGVRESFRNVYRPGCSEH